jgi:hypothetical protein
LAESSAKAQELQAQAADLAKLLEGANPAEAKAIRALLVQVNQKAFDLENPGMAAATAVTQRQRQAETDLANTVRERSRNMNAGVATPPMSPQERAQRAAEMAANRALQDERFAAEIAAAQQRERAEKIKALRDALKR